MTETTRVRKYKDRLRVFLIILIFSKDIEDGEHPYRRKVLKGEVKIQKIDFLLRNPDYLAYDLLTLADEEPENKEEIKKTIQKVMNDKEPTIRRLKMKRSLFGAYEDIDDVIAYLRSRDLIDFSSKRTSDVQRTIKKKYYITQFALEKVEGGLSNYKSFDWYIKRCCLIKRYFGDLSGTQLKVRQYNITEYEDTAYGEYIQNIHNKVHKRYHELFGENLS